MGRHLTRGSDAEELPDRWPPLEEDDMAAREFVVEVGSEASWHGESAYRVRSTRPAARRVDCLDLMLVAYTQIT